MGRSKLSPFFSQVVQSDAGRGERFSGTVCLTLLEEAIIARAMDSLLLLIFVTAGLLIAISRAVGRLAASQNPQLGAKLRKTSLHDTVGKIDSALQLFKTDLDAAKLAPGNTQYTHYYCGYIYGMAKEIARANQIELSLQVKLPVLLEVSRVCGNGGEDFAQGEQLLETVMDNGYARAGETDGTQDAADALNPEFTGPYWEKLDRFFKVSPSLGKA